MDLVGMKSLLPRRRPFGWTDDGSGGSILTAEAEQERGPGFVGPQIDATRCIGCHLEANAATADAAGAAPTACEGCHRPAQ
jgi:hypothetical protein